jgi:hypothetical protein
VDGRAKPGHDGSSPGTAMTPKETFSKENARSEAGASIIQCRRAAPSTIPRIKSGGRMVPLPRLTRGRIRGDEAGARGLGRTPPGRGGS